MFKDLFRNPVKHRRARLGLGGFFAETNSFNFWFIHFLINSQNLSLCCMKYTPFLVLPLYFQVREATCNLNITLIWNITSINYIL